MTTFITSFVLFLLLICGQEVQAQTNSKNYVLTRSPRTKISDPAKLNDLSANKDSINSVIQYLDGLGRPVQTINVQGSRNGKDVVQHQEYDALGREVKKYLPYPDQINADGSFKSTALSKLIGFYASPTAQVSSTSFPFSETRFEASPLNRVLEQGSPGTEWQLSTSGVTGSGHTVKLEYTSNNITSFSDLSNTRRVTFYKVNINATTKVRSLALGSPHYYAANELYVTVTKDENWTSGRSGTMEEYKDKEGRVIVKRVFNTKPGGSLEMLSTYYVYDDFGNLCYVLPPGAIPDAQEISNFPTTDNIANFAYQYEYDGRQRMIQKKLPGILPELFVYNNLDQKVASQDGHRKNNAKSWRYFKYDAHGRVIVTGWFGDGSITYSRPNIEDLVNDNTVLWESRANTGLGYDNLAWPQGSTNYYDVSYYDNYNIYLLPAGYTFQAYNGRLEESKKTTGLLTGTLTRSNNSTLPLWTIHYYDDEGRLIQMNKKNQMTTTSKDIINNSYDFVGQLVTTQRAHTGTTGQAVTIINDYEYDHAGRRLAVTSQIGAEKVVLARNEYNELGQLVDKKLHQVGQSRFLQSVDYRYNTRGWLTSINDPALGNLAGVNDDDAAISDADKFGLALNYTSGTKPQYNGNIASMNWGTSNKGILGYKFVYDGLSRLNEAVSLDHMFDENVRYDVMGNITQLGRWAKISGVRQQIDSLAYSYTGNQLNDVDDSAPGTLGYTDNTGVVMTDMTYDENGRLVKDANKGISTFKYDGLGLTSGVVFASGAEIIYDSDRLGTKLKKTVKDAAGATVGTTHYVGGIQYITPPGTTTAILDFIQTEEGRIRKTNGSYFYEYDLKDHLGNTRVTVKQSGTTAAAGTAEVIQEDSYYAFGMQMPGTNAGGSEQNKYLYNGKELQSEYGLNQYDYGARFYDPVIGRWTIVDPLAEQGRRWSPYVYAFNNPIIFTDPDGQWPTWAQLKASATSTYNQAKSSGASTYNQAKSSASQTYNRTVAATKNAYNVTAKTVEKGAVAAQKWTADNKGTLLSVAKGMQQAGDNAATLGAVVAIAGAPIAGVGAAPGAAYAGGGAIVSGAGAVMEAIVEGIAGSGKNAGITLGNEAVYIGLSKLGDAAIDAAFPGNLPDMSAELKEGMKEAVGLVQGAIKGKTDKVIDNNKDKQ